MQVKLENVFSVDQPIERVWAFLSDPRKVATCLPGAEILEVVSEAEYEGRVRVKLGPFATQFKGNVVIERLDDQKREIHLVGKGKDRQGTGSASMVLTGKLIALPDGRTEMSTTSDLTISGKLAQFGSRMIEDVSKSMFKRFNETFAERLEAEAEGREVTSKKADSVKVSQIAGVVVKRAVGRIFGKEEE